MDPLGAMFNLTGKLPTVVLKNETGRRGHDALTVGMPLSVPGPKRSPIQLPFLKKNGTGDAKLDDLIAALNRAVMAKGTG
jgi:hypothetical protein